MKTLYELAMIASLLVVIGCNSVSVAVPPQAVFASDLLRHAEDWELGVTGEPGWLRKWEAQGGDDAKKLLLRFIEDNENRTDDPLLWGSIVAAVVFLFSLAGWLRERAFLKAARASERGRQG